MQFANLPEIAFELDCAIEAAAKRAGFDIADTGASAQSCSSYITLEREDEMGENAQRLAIRISDHTARSCISDVDYHISLGDGDRFANDKLYLDEVSDEDDEFICFAVEQSDLDRVVQAAVAAAETADWEEL